MTKRQLREQLKLGVVFPAKAKICSGQKSFTLTQSNHRLLGEGEKSLWNWLALCEEAKVDIDAELRVLVRRHIGRDYDVKLKKFSGYLGVASNIWYEVVKRKVKISRNIKKRE
ncbi:MAG: hypothetical protein NUV53_02500 [Patescibacteria group bacterium]|nr:hypothetical protein [Patescibacteria group bacterium]